MSIVLIWFSFCVCGCVWVGGNGAGVGGSGLSLLCRDLSTIWQSAPGLSAWSCLMKTRCFPWLLLPSRTSPASSQPTLANPQINTHAAHLINTLTDTHPWMYAKIHTHTFPLPYFFASCTYSHSSILFLSYRHTETGLTIQSYINCM